MKTVSAFKSTKTTLTATTTSEKEYLATLVENWGQGIEFDGTTATGKKEIIHTLRVGMEGGGYNKETG